MTTATERLTVLPWLKNGPALRAGLQNFGHQGIRPQLLCFVIPVAKELNLKAAARAVGEKSVEMIHVKDLLQVTGYIRGGCSPPLRMKRAYPTVIDASCQNLSTIIVSGENRLSN